MGQSICKGRRDAVVDVNNVDNNNVSNPAEVVVDEELDVSQLPIRLPPLIEDLDEDGYESGSFANGNNEAISKAIATNAVKALLPKTEEDDVEGPNASKAIGGGMIEVGATPEEVAELDKSNLPIYLDLDMATRPEEATNAAKILKCLSPAYDEDHYSEALDRSNMPILLDEPPPKGDQNETASSSAAAVHNTLQYDIDDDEEGLKQSRKNENSSEIATDLEIAELDRSNMPISLDPILLDEPERKKEEKENHMDDKGNGARTAIAQSSSNGSVTKEERIEDSSFNKNVQLSPNSASKQVLKTLNSTEETSTGSNNIAAAVEEGRASETIATLQQDHNFVTNRTEKFAIMDLLANDYMRDDDKSEGKGVSADNDIANEEEEQREPLIQLQASSNDPDNGLTLVQTDKFAVYNPSDNIDQSSS